MSEPVSPAMGPGVHGSVLGYLRDAAAKAGDQALLDEFTARGEERLARMMFSNLRGQSGGPWRGLRLSKAGLEIMCRYFRPFEIALPDGARLHNRSLLYLDAQARMPYYASGEGFVVFETRLGVKLKLAEGCLDTLREMDGV